MSETQETRTPDLTALREAVSAWRDAKKAAKGSLSMPLWGKVDDAEVRVLRIAARLADGDYA